jgi:hypothetical protein
MYNLYDWNKPHTDPANTSVVSQNIPTYLCPSGVIRRTVPTAGCDSNRAPGTYAVCSGSKSGWVAPLFGGTDPNNGIVTGFGSAVVRMRDVLDGTSNTLMVGESAWNLPDYMFTSGPCNGQVRWGFTYWSSPYPLSTMFSTLGTFNPKRLNGDSSRLGNFRSDHVGGVQFTMGDGSVRFVSENIDHRLLDATATRAGGEVISEF